MGRTWLALSTAVVLAAAACGPRDPGPHESERELVTYWLVTAADLVYGDLCTDSPEWRDQVAAPQVEENSYLIYKVDDAGETAVAQRCETTLASSCTDSPLGIVFEIDGHILTWDPPPESQYLTPGTCKLQMDQLWSLEDMGETLDWVIDLVMTLTGDESDCETIEATVKAASPNGKGFEGCVVTMTIDAEFSHAGRP
jgi:hypothetical protein